MEEGEEVEEVEEVEEGEEVEEVEDLFLPAAHLSSFLSALRLKLVRKVHDEGMSVGFLGRLDNFFLARILPASSSSHVRTCDCSTFHSGCSRRSSWQTRPESRT